MGTALFRGALFIYTSVMLDLSNIILSIKNSQKTLFILCGFPDVAFITAYADTIPKAKKKAMKLVTALNVPHSFHRTDIGDRVHKHDLPMLKKWGWV